MGQQYSRTLDIDGFITVPRQHCPSGIAVTEQRNTRVCLNALRGPVFLSVPLSFPTASGVSASNYRAIQSYPCSFHLPAWKREQVLISGRLQLVSRSPGSRKGSALPYDRIQHG
ncbi:Hypothetical protein NTJ_13341 [Nesidiocoris tenuis]|uniref:Uncharacterized protein n=1 Tax=Nesidiocoris tenuis TaxID=355587 RepID=A0ABN7B800_9HEMI|nr:Hypothetical protein NTJ_13341 [Nesidiocoris tenuis]